MASPSNPDHLRARIRAADATLVDDTPLDLSAKSAAELKQQAKDPDPDVRAAAMAALVALGRGELLPEVVKALRSEDPRVVIGAAVVLGRAGDRAVVPNLIEAFQTEDEQVGAAVAWALGRLGDRAVAPWLIAAVEQGFAAVAACEALGRLKDERGRRPLLRALAGDDVRLRVAAARALGRLGGAAAELEAALQDAEPAVRLAAAVALYELGESADAVEDALAALGKTP